MLAPRVVPLCFFAVSLWLWRIVAAAYVLVVVAVCVGMAGRFGAGGLRSHGGGCVRKWLRLVAAVVSVEGNGG